MNTMQALVAAATLLSLGWAGADEHEAQSGLFRQSMVEADLQASRLIGMRVHARDTAATDSMALTDVGEVHDLIISRDGMVEAAVVDIGGFLGIGERQVAITMSSLEFRDDQTTDYKGDFLLVIAVTQAMLESAPEYDMSIMDELPGSAVGLQQPVDSAISDAVAPLDSSPRVTGVTDLSVMDDYVPIPVDQVTSEELTGARVYTSSGDEIGEVSELLFDGDQVDKAVIDVGGFLGIGEKPVALDIADLELLQYPSSGEIRVRVPMSEEQLEALPKYE